MAGLSIYCFLRYTRFGFEITVSGENAAAARYARIPYRALLILVMALCGALAGLAGLIEVSNAGTLQKTLPAGYGYTAIVVAWLSRLNIGVIAVSSLLLAGLRVGTEDLQIVHQVPWHFANIVEGLLLLAVLAGQFFSRYSLRRAA
jgi:simple sugar transport system permease protein